MSCFDKIRSGFNRDDNLRYKKIKFRLVFTHCNALASVITDLVDYKSARVMLGIEDQSMINSETYFETIVFCQSGIKHK